MNAMPEMPSPNLQVMGYRLQPIWTDTQHAWCGRDLWVYRYHYASRSLQAAFRLPRRSDSLGGRLRDVLARSWVKRWLCPGLDIDTLAELPGGDLVVLFDRVYWFDPAWHAGQAEVLPQHGDTRPLAMPLRGGMAVHSVSRCAYFGEYLNGTHREIRVARVDVDRRRVEVCWTFARSDIKHVHAIHYDRFRNRLWVCTGDQDHESAFWYTDDEFRTVHRFAGGDQSWRAIAMLFDEHGMEWGMDAGQDAPKEAINRIFRYDFGTHERTELAVVGNPVYAACDVGDGTAVMQTAFEPKRAAIPPHLKSLFGIEEQIGAGEKRYRLTTDRAVYGMLLMPRGVAPCAHVLFTPAHCVRGNGRLHALDVCPDHE